jgi:hypothetical protein
MKTGRAGSRAGPPRSSAMPPVQPSPTTTPVGSFGRPAPFRSLTAIWRSPRVRSRARRRPAGPGDRVPALPPARRRRPLQGRPFESCGSAPRPPCEEVVRIARVLQTGERLSRASTVRRPRRAGEHGVDRRADELHVVAELLGCDVRDEVVKGPCSLLVAEVERLERVVQERGHLPELAAEQLLDGGGACRIGIRRRR